MARPSGCNYTFPACAQASKLHFGFQHGASMQRRILLTASVSLAAITLMGCGPRLSEHEAAGGILSGTEIPRQRAARSPLMAGNGQPLTPARNAGTSNTNANAGGHGPGTVTTLPTTLRSLPPGPAPTPTPTPPPTTPDRQ